MFIYTLIILPLETFIPSFILLKPPRIGGINRSRGNVDIALNTKDDVCDLNTLFVLTNEPLL